MKVSFYSEENKNNRWRLKTQDSSGEEAKGLSEIQKRPRGKEEQPGLREPRVPSMLGEVLQRACNGTGSPSPRHCLPPPPSSAMPSPALTSTPAPSSSFAMPCPHSVWPSLLSPVSCLPPLFLHLALPTPAFPSSPSYCPAPF